MGVDSREGQGSAGGAFILSSARDTNRLPEGRAPTLWHFRYWICVQSYMRTRDRYMGMEESRTQPKSLTLIKSRLGHLYPLSIQHASKSPAAGCTPWVHTGKSGLCSYNSSQIPALLSPNLHCFILLLPSWLRQCNGRTQACSDHSSDIKIPNANNR